MRKPERLWDFHDRTALSIYGTFDKIGDAARACLNYLIAPSFATFDVSEDGAGGTTFEEAQRVLDITRNNWHRISMHTAAKETFGSGRGNVSFVYNSKGQLSEITFFACGWFGNYRKSNKKVHKMAEGLGLKLLN